MNYSSPPYIPTISISDQQHLLEKLQVFKIQGRDKHGRKVLRIVGKFFPARSVSNEAVNKYLEEKIFPKLGDKAFFSVVYVHTDVNRGDNFPGISTLPSIYEAIPTTIKDRLQAVYFLHPGLQAKLFLATFGRLLFTGGLYKKLKYVTRLEFLWVQVRRNEVEVPDFVYDYDEQLEYRPMMDYGLESDHPRVHVLHALYCLARLHLYWRIPVCFRLFTVTSNCTKSSSLKRTGLISVSYSVPQLKRLRYTQHNRIRLSRIGC